MAWRRGGRRTEVALNLDELHLRGLALGGTEDGEDGNDLLRRAVAPLESHQRRHLAIPNRPVLVLRRGHKGDERRRVTQGRPCADLHLVGPADIHCARRRLTGPGLRA